MNVNDIAYAIDCEGEVYSVFPIWIGESLASLTPIDTESFEYTGESFRLLLGDLFEDYTLLDQNQVIIHDPLMEDEDE